MFYLILFTMNLFSVNQVTQAYVVNGVTDEAGAVPTTEAKNLSCKAAPDKKSFYFKYFGKGKNERTDIIDVDKILWAKATPASKMAKSLKTAVVTLNPAFIDSDNYVSPVGQDFLLRLAFNGYIGVSPEDSTYWKYGLVHVTANMTDSDFYIKMARSIFNNMRREAVKFIEVAVATSGSDVLVPDIVDGSTIATGVKIWLTEPDWILGLKQQRVMEFDAIPTTVAVLNTNGTYDDLVWGDMVDSLGNKTTGGSTVALVSLDTPVTPVVTLTNGKLAADYEYFFHGERGDQYRMMGWPDYVPTTYMVDPSKEYDFVQIHFAYIGPNESCQKSEKDLVFLCPRDVSEADADEPGALAQAVIATIGDAGIEGITFKVPGGTDIVTEES